MPLAHAPLLVRSLTVVAAVALAVGASHGAEPVGVAPARAARTPRIVLDRTTCTLGALRAREKREGAFVVRNDGTGPLHLQARGSCGCTPVTISTSVVEPGATATVTVAVEAGLTKGELRKTAYLSSDDPEHPVTTLTVEGDVAQGVMLSRSAVVFGAVLVGAAPRASIDVLRYDGAATCRVRAARVTGLAPTGPRVAVDVEPLEVPGAVGRHVVVRFLDPPPVGPIAATLVLSTDDEGAGDLSVPVWGQVSRPVMVTPREIHLGAVAPRAAPRPSLVVRPFDATVSLGRVTARARNGRVTAAVSAGTEPGTFAVSVGVGEDARAGALDDVLELTTDVAGEPVIEVAVRAEVAGATSGR